MFEQDSILHHSKEFFDNRFLASNKKNEQVLRHVVPWVTNEHNLELMRPFREEEFEKALSWMHSDKARLCGRRCFFAI